MMRRFLAASTETLGARRVRVIAATSDLARDGLILAVGGLAVENFRRNPIVLWSHDPTQPVAKATDIAVANGRLLATIDFAAEGISECADRVCGLVKGGVVSGVSIGFDILETQPDRGARDQPRTITRSELYEISFVAVPSDTGAMVVERSAGMRRGLTAEEMRHIHRAAQLVDEADGHTHDARRAHERKDRPGVDDAHRKLARCLRGARAAFRSLEALGAQADLDASKTIQSSDGVGIDAGSSPAKQPGRSALRYDPNSPIPLPDRIAQAAMDHVNAVFAASGGTTDFERRQAEARRLRVIHDGTR